MNPADLNRLSRPVRRGWTRPSLLAAGVLTALCLRSLPAAARAQGQEDAAKSLAGALQRIETHGEAAYEAARLADWPRARAEVRALGQVAATVARGIAGDGEPALAKQMWKLVRAVHDKDRLAAMRAANAITFWEADAGERHGLSVPAAIKRLDCYGRRWQTLLEEGDQEGAAKSRAKLAQTWKEARPLIEAHGGVGEATRYAGLMDGLELRAEPGEPALAAEKLVREVPPLEKVFAR